MIHSDDDKTTVIKLLKGVLEAQSQKDPQATDVEERAAWRLAAARLPLLRQAELCGVFIESWNAPRRTNRAHALVWMTEFDGPTLVEPLKTLIEAVESDALTEGQIMLFNTIGSVVHTRLRVAGASNVIGFDVPDSNGALIWRDVDETARRAEALA